MSSNDRRRKSNFHSVNEHSLTIAHRKKTAIETPTQWAQCQLKNLQSNLALTNQMKSIKVENKLKNSSEAFEIYSPPIVRRFEQIYPFNGSKELFKTNQSNVPRNQKTYGEPRASSANAQSNNLRITLSESKRVIQHRAVNNRIEPNATQSNVADKMDLENRPAKQVFQVFRYLLSGDINSLISQNVSKSEEREMKPLKYIVIDTNILLTSLMFVKDLLEKNDKVPGSPTLIIPYMVLQELDKLKMQSDQLLSQSASRAIKFINKHLKNLLSKISGQTAMDHKKTLIDVDSSDDYILNCCLQLKQNHSKIGILSNDVNLRNKALCSNIEAFSYDELKSILCF